MQEVIKVLWCDHHLIRDGVRQEADRTPSISLDGVAADLDFCTECDEEILGPLRRVLAAIGKRASGSNPPLLESEPGRKSETRTQCPICLNWMSVRNRQKHSKESHEIEAGKIAWRYGPDVDEVWPCSCGLTFPTTAGRSRHGRFYEEHDTSGDVSIEALRPVETSPSTEAPQANLSA